MARNINPWYKTFPERWLDSERVQDMSLASEGLYRRCIDYQAKHGSIPANLTKLARVLRKDPAEVSAAWASVQPHFTPETNDEGEPRLFNIIQRELLDEVQKATDARVQAAKDTNKKIKEKSSVEKPNGQRSGDRALRASSSLSYSLSDSISDFNTFWAAYPAFRKKDKKAAQASWKRNVTSAEIAQQIITHVQDRAASDPEWLEEDGKFSPLPTTFLNRARWNDEYTRAGSNSSGKGKTAAAPMPVAIKRPVFEALNPDHWRNTLYTASLADSVTSEMLQEIKPLGMYKGTAWLQAESQWSRDWLLKNYRDELQRDLQALVRIVVPSEFEDEAKG